ncbi:replication factor A [Halarchaeum salinum]|uniref:Replication protein A n=1 Tax=Halarchaeum salinum TaxID=489912 RepID=A0AAV3SBA1_9EURY
MSDIQQTAQQLHDQFSEHLDVDVEEIEERLERYVDEYKIPLDEARRSVESHYLDEADIERDELGRGGNPTVQAADVDAPDEWVDITAKVVDLWEPRSDSVAQVGLLGDESGTIKFTKWAASDLDELDEGQVYHLGNVVTDEYQGRYSVNLNRTTTITESEEDIEVGDDEATVEGALVDIQSGSGLIKRCPHEDCTRVLQNGRCSEHGEVEGEFDLRIKGVLDDGMDVHEIILNEEATTDLTGVTLEEAKQQAMDALDTTVVADEMRETLLGKYYRVSGPTLGRYVLANDIEELNDPVDGESVLIKARSM